MENNENDILNKILFLRKRFREESMKEIFENGNKSIIEIYEKNVAKNNYKSVDRFSTDRSKNLISQIDR